MSPKNMIIFLADEHQRDVLGCYGHPLVQTPTLDKLAATGTRFTSAYTPSPVCVPARAAFATGKWVHQTRCWSNSEPFHGQIRGWGQQLIDAGHDVLSIGKLHYRSVDDANGFSEEVIPLHVRNGLGWIQGLLRVDGPGFVGTEHFAEEIGPGEDSYTDYDRRVTENTVRWLKTEGMKKRDKPWVLFVSYLRPHYPLTCPKEYYDMYPLDKIEPPRFAGPEAEFANPVIKAIRDFYNYDDHFDEHSRLVGRASYYGLCSFIDDQVKEVLTALDDSNQDRDTAIVYTSDHGDHIGEHGMWTKCTMYEESAAIPLILSGAGAPVGVCDTATSLVDIHQTVLSATGLVQTPQDKENDADLPGRSLYDIAAEPYQDRTVLSEYHDGGAITGMFMIRHGKWKYCYYPGHPPQMFDLDADPLEAKDLGQLSAYADQRAKCHAEMLKVVDADAMNDQCFADQARLIEELGGYDGIMGRESFDFTPVE